MENEAKVPDEVIGYWNPRTRAFIEPEVYTSMKADLPDSPIVAEWLAIPAPAAGVALPPAPDPADAYWKGFADGQKHAAAGALVDRPSLAEGFDGSSVRAGLNHSTIEIWYDTHEQAVAARKYFNELVDAARAALSASEPVAWGIFWQGRALQTGHTYVTEERANAALRGFHDAHEYDVFPIYRGHPALKGEAEEVLRELVEAADAWKKLDVGSGESGRRLAAAWDRARSLTQPKDAK
jgi:hypothetical protein